MKGPRAGGVQKWAEFLSYILWSPYEISIKSIEFCDHPYYHSVWDHKSSWRMKHFVWNYFCFLMFHFNSCTIMNYHDCHISINLMYFNNFLYFICKDKFWKKVFNSLLCGCNYNEKRPLFIIDRRRSLAKQGDNALCLSVCLSVLSCLICKW